MPKTTVTETVETNTTEDSINTTKLAQLKNFVANNRGNIAAVAASAAVGVVYVVRNRKTEVENPES